MDCGFGNIVKGVKKRKNPCDRRRQNDPCPGLRGDESLHTLLSKLDLVEKKLDKLDRSIGTSVGNRDDSSSKIKVKLPDQWLNAINSYQASGRQPVLEVSVETDFKDEDVREVIRSPCNDSSRTAKTTAETPAVIPKDAEPIRYPATKDGLVKFQPASSNLYENPVEPKTEPDMSASNQSGRYGYSTEHLENPRQMATEPEMSALNWTVPLSSKPQPNIRRRSIPDERVLSNLLRNWRPAPRSVPPPPKPAVGNPARTEPGWTVNRLMVFFVAVKTSPSGRRLLCEKYIPAGARPNPDISPFLCQANAQGIFRCTRTVEDHNDFIPIVPRTESNPMANCLIPLVGSPSGSDFICAEVIRNVDQLLLEPNEPDVAPSAEQVIIEKPNEPAVAPKAGCEVLLPEKQGSKDLLVLERLCCNHCKNRIGKVVVAIDGANNCRDSPRIPFVTKSSEGVAPCPVQDQKQGTQKDCKPCADAQALPVVPATPDFVKLNSRCIEAVRVAMNESVGVEYLLKLMDILEKKYERMLEWQEFLKRRLAPEMAMPEPALLQQYPTTKNTDPRTPCSELGPKAVSAPMNPCGERSRCESELPPRPYTPYTDFAPRFYSTPKKCGDENQCGIDLYGTSPPYTDFDPRFYSTPKRCGEGNKLETELPSSCSPCFKAAQNSRDAFTKRRRSLDMNGPQHRRVLRQETSSLPTPRNASSMNGNYRSKENNEPIENNEAKPPGPCRKSPSPQISRNSSINGNQKSREINESKEAKPPELFKGPPSTPSTNKEIYESESIVQSKRSERRSGRRTSLIAKKSSPVEYEHRREDVESRSSVTSETRDESGMRSTSKRNKIYYAMELPTSAEKNSTNDNFKLSKANNELSDLIISEGQIITSHPSLDVIPYESLHESDLMIQPVDESIHSPSHSESRSLKPGSKVAVLETQGEKAFTDLLTCQSRSANPSVSSKLSGHQEANTMAAAQSNVTNMQMVPVYQPAIENYGLEHSSNATVAVSKDSFSKKELLKHLMDPSTVKVIDQIRTKTSKIDTVIRTGGKTMNSSQTTTFALRNLKTYSPMRSESNAARTRTINVRTVIPRKCEMENHKKSRKSFCSSKEVSRIESKFIKKGVKSRERIIDSSTGRRNIPASHGSLWATRVSDAERKRIHKLARSLETTRRNRPPISLSHEDKHELDKSNRTFQDPRKKTAQDSYLNEKYLKELIFPFASQVADPPADHSRKYSIPRRIMFERVFKINRRTVREATNFTGMEEGEVDDNSISPVSSDTSRNPLRVEESRDDESRDDKPGICGSSNSGQPPQSNRSSESLSSPADNLKNGVTNMALFIEYLHDTLMEIDGSSDRISKDTTTRKTSDTVKDLIFDRLSAYQDSTDSSGQNRDYPYDSTTINQSSHDESDERNRDLETLLRDSIVNLLYRHFNRTLRCSDDGDETNASNATKRAAVSESVSQDSIIKECSRIRPESTIFHQETKHVSEAQKNHSSDYEPNQACLHLASSSNDSLHDLTESSTDQDFSREKSWESVHFDPFACTSSPVSYPSASTLNHSRFTKASSEENDAGTLLRRASEIMDLLEIYPRPQRTESQLERTGLWIRNVQKGYHNKTEKLKNEEIKKTKETREKVNEGLSNTIIKFPKKKIISSSILHRKHRVPKCLKNKSGSDHFDDSKEEKYPKQKLVVYMNESRNFFKTECKYGCNRLPKTAPEWIRQAKPQEVTTNNDSSDGVGRSYKTVPINYKIHSHLRSRGQHHHHDHSNKRKNVSDDFEENNAISVLEENDAEKRKRFLIVNKRRLAKELGVIKSDSSSSSSTSHKRKPGPQKVDVHPDNRRRRITFADDEDYRKTSVGIDSHPEPRKIGTHGGTDRNEARKMKPAIRDRETDKKTYQSKSKRVHSNTPNIKLMTRAAPRSRSEISVSSMEHSYDDPRRISRYPRTRTFPHNMPRTVQPIAKRKEQNTPMNYRQRLITSDSKSSAGYDRVNVRDFIDFLSTLSRNTIGTLTNKKKALRLYKNYLTNPTRHK